ncbi:MAG: phospholipase D-like domain-containing protein [Candidatus Sericytochromatia bacterium]|nr:phospholipase D-like domain-containing protein [Candidatus Sericytochromatia bacterium]
MARRVVPVLLVLAACLQAVLPATAGAADLLESIRAREVYDARRPLRAMPCSSGEEATAQVWLRADAEEIYPRALALIDAAREEVLLDMYLLGGRIGHRVAAALARARDRGCRVHVTTCPVEQTIGTTTDLLVAQWAVMRKADLAPEAYPLSRLPKAERNPLTVIDHAKVLVCDRRRGMMGGANLFEIADTDHDLMLEFEGDIGEALAREVARPFGWPLPPLQQPVVAPRADGKQASLALVRNDEEMACGKEHLMRLLRGARHRIEAGVFEFSDLEVAEALVAAHRRGVAVKVLLDRHRFDGKWSGGPTANIPRWGVPNLVVAERLLEAGVPVRWYEARRDQEEFHAKYAIIDGEVGFFGSLNWTPSAFHRFRELNVHWQGPSVRLLESSFLGDWNRHAQPVRRLDAWQRWGARAIEWLDRQGICYW